MRTHILATQIAHTLHVINHYTFTPEELREGVNEIEWELEHLDESNETLEGVLAELEMSGYDEMAARLRKAMNK